ncbi:glycoside hydrolase family 10 protein [Sediminitomix flava]|uniref:Uncharacterized lipoprotein YddW (UPF0748 family) n=1 Tax=Sediminitomix flava TaxID=379075 RepID=A0A315ZGU5_SEDFL|nr:family 10 glycosylhydrolase [Sediminitomix flava]PWJ44825.1 uncharacterized lipoprotein YddW (UPF0748 family) [Sediminitomix flava]
MRLLISIKLLLGLLIFQHLSSFAQSGIKREFRGVWIATVNNIDWPSKPGLSSDEQKQEFIEVLDHHLEDGLNAVFVQVRAAGDAIYNSRFEPWSSCFTGTQGQPPNPYYDPLSFMIEEAHRRGMEFHAWINPFRAVTNTEKVRVSSDHPIYSNPSWFLDYGTLKLFNPGIPEVRAYVCDIILDLIKNYDLDGVHFDDYFYPYPEYGKVLKDRSAYYKYREKGQGLADWRRENINDLIYMTHKTIKNYNSKIKFGVSPFGVWRNKRESPYGSPTLSGYTNYDHLYADVRHWMENGWVDYIAPQVYQSTQHDKIPYKPLVTWWAENAKELGCHLYVGQAAYRLHNSLEAGWKDNYELSDQILHNRRERVEGTILYNSTSLIRNKGHIVDTLRQNYFYHPALLPTMSWIDSVAPLEPSNAVVSMSPRGVTLSWQKPQKAKDGEEPYWYVIYCTNNDKEPNVKNPADILRIIPASETQFLDVDATSIDQYNYKITSLDRHQNESKEVKVITEQVAK